MRSSISILALAALPALALAADQGVPRIILDRDLTERDHMLVSVNDERLRYRDTGGIVRSKPVRAVFAITTPAASESHLDTEAPAEEADAPPAGVLELIDGQRLIGSLAAASAEGNPSETIHWEHPRLGTLEFILDDISTIALVAGIDPSPSGDIIADLLILQNGDRLEGFVEGIGSAIRIETDGHAREVPIDRIAEIHLANPRQALTGRVAWLTDGSIVACSRLADAPDGTVALTLRGGPSSPRPASDAASVQIPIAHLGALAFEADALIPLAGLPIAAEHPAEGRRWTPPLEVRGLRKALLGAADVEFPGPMTVEWDLPEAAAYFAATAELPESMWNWGDCELFITLISGGDENRLFHARINADNWFQRIHLDLRSLIQEGAPARLRIHIDPGKYGPIQDRIILRMPLVALESQRG